MSSEPIADLTASITAVLQKIRPEATDFDTKIRTLDSLGLAELVAALEDELQIFIPDTMLDDRMFSSVSALATSMGRLMPPRSGQPAS